MGDIASTSSKQVDFKNTSENKINPNSYENKNVQIKSYQKQTESRVFPLKENAYHSGKNVAFLEPEIVERTNWELKHAGFAIAFAFILVLVQFGTMTVMDLNAVNSWILAFVLIVIFGIAVYFLLEPKTTKEIKQRIVETELQTIDRPVLKEVLKTVEIEKPVIKEIPIIKEIEVYKEPQTVYVAAPIPVKKKRAPAIQYDFMGSKLTNVYHTAQCRLGKSIKAKYRVKSTNSAYFRKLKYRPCEVCIKKTKKV